MPRKAMKQKERGGNGVMRARTSRSSNGRAGTSSRSGVMGAVKAGVEKISRSVESMGEKASSVGGSRATSSRGRKSAKSRTTATGRKKATASSAARPSRSVSSTQMKRPVGRPAHLPINNYGTLSIGDIRSRLSNLSKGDLRKVMNFERRHQGRRTIISDIERRLKSA